MSFNKGLRACCLLFILLGCPISIGNSALFPGHAPIPQPREANSGSTSGAPSSSCAVSLPFPSLFRGSVSPPSGPPSFLRSQQPPASEPSGPEGRREGQGRPLPAAPFLLWLLLCPPAPAAPSSLRLSTPSACPPLLSSFGEVLLTVPGFGPFYSFCTVYVAPSCNRCCGKGDTCDLSH